jgi:hypothetical protein
MRNLASRIIWAIVFALFFAGSSFAQASLRVYEAATRIEFSSSGSLVSLKIENQTREKVDACVRLELLDPRGTVQAEARQNTSLPRGSTALKITLPPAFAQNEDPDRRNLLWYRLRYTIAANPSIPSLKAPVVGVISVGEITQGIFELHVAGPSFVREGARLAPTSMLAAFRGLKLQKLEK